MSNYPTLKLIGFDVRYVYRGFPPLLQDNNVRERHLSRVDLKTLISFDREVVPRRFIHREKLVAGRTTQPGEIAIEKGENVGFDLFYLWDDLFDMLASYQADRENQDCALAYAVADLTRDGINPPQDDMYEVLISTPTNPADVDSQWPMLGFDIVNLYFQSFLSSFDLIAAAGASIRQALAPRINSVGLVANEKDCPEVVRLANSSVADHGPFFALATYLIWDRSGILASGVASGEHG